jgi:hypothetical protein
LIRGGDEKPLLPERTKELWARLLPCGAGESGEKWATTADHIAPDELIELCAVATLTHLIEPRCKDAAIPCCRASRLFKRRWRTTPTFSLGNLSCLPRRYAQCRRTNMHNLSLCARRNEAQLCNAAPDQRDTGSIWSALHK